MIAWPQLSPVYSKPERRRSYHYLDREPHRRIAAAVQHLNELSWGIALFEYLLQVPAKPNRVQRDVARAVEGVSS